MICFTQTSFHDSLDDNFHHPVLVEGSISLSYGDVSTTHDAIGGDPRLSRIILLQCFLYLDLRWNKFGNMSYLLVFVEIVAFPHLGRVSIYKSIVSLQYLCYFLF